MFAHLFFNLKFKKRQDGAKAAHLLQWGQHCPQLFSDFIWVAWHMPGTKSTDTGLLRGSTTGLIRALPSTTMLVSSTWPAIITLPPEYLRPASVSAVRVKVLGKDAGNLKR